MNKQKMLYQMFDGKLIGGQEMKQHVIRVIANMSEEIIEFVTKNVWFLASIEDAWAFTFSGNDLKNQHMIFLSDELLNQDYEQIRYTIAHEIGHVILGHKNSVTVKQTKEEINKQEREADMFARKYI